MAYRYVPVDRDQPFLLPPDMRDWLPESHLVWFVLAVLTRVDTSALHARHPNDGAGRPAYDPDMVLGLLVYAYCTGQRSSRAIERLCEVDVAYRVICANRAPDHSTIARFRQVHQDIALELFTDVLVLCAAAGLAKVGVVAIDGTKMGTDASLKANRSRAHIQAEVTAIWAEAGAVDAEEDDRFGDTRGDELPADLSDPRRRAARLEAALAELEAQAAQAAQAEAAKVAAFAERKQAAHALGQLPASRPPAGADPVAEAQAALAVQAARAAERARVRAELEARNAAAGHKTRGTKPDHDNHRDLRRARERLARAQAAATAAAALAAAAEVNTTDPDSRVMKSPQGWVQGYNAQAAVNEMGVVLAASVTQDHNDVGQCQPMMAATAANLEAAGIAAPIGTVVLDAGYWSEENATAPGPDRLIATAKNWKLRQALQAKGQATREPPPGATPAEAMEHRLRTAEGRRLYAKRATTVEPVFGQHKDGRGFRRFVRRGLAAADAEWQLINATHNILKMFRNGVQLS
jgi:transposase